MTCKAIERLILESEDRPLSADERRAVEGHLRVCPGCRAFEAGRRRILEGLKDIRWAELPPSVGSRTRQMCLEALGGVVPERGRAPGKTRIPVPVIAASVLFTVLAVVWLTLTLVDVAPGQPLPSSAWAAIVFIAQNVLMLFLSPVVFRAVRPWREDNPSFE